MNPALTGSRAGDNLTEAEVAQPGWNNGYGGPNTGLGHGGNRLTHGRRSPQALVDFSGGLRGSAADDQAIPTRRAANRCSGHTGTGAGGGTMELISPTDSDVSVGPSRVSPVHVGGLQLFEPPGRRTGFRPGDLRVADRPRGRPADLPQTSRRVVGGIANIAWSFDRDLDLEYHAPLALPSPGRVRRVARAHLAAARHPARPAPAAVGGAPGRGLADGRFAVYTKVHHALLDGVTAMKTMRRALSTDPQDTDFGCRGAASAHPQ